MCLNVFVSSRFERCESVSNCCTSHVFSSELPREKGRRLARVRQIKDDQDDIICDFLMPRGVPSLQTCQCPSRGKMRRNQMRKPKLRQVGPEGLLFSQCALMDTGYSYCPSLVVQLVKRIQTRVRFLLSGDANLNKI